MPLMVFRIGGKPFSIKAEEVAGVEPWPVSMPVPGTTPRFREVLRRGRTVHPVYDLAGEWSLSPDTEAPLCLLLKWGAEEVAVRVDSQIPSLETTDADMIRPALDAKPGFVGTWRHQGIEIPLISVAARESGVQEAA